MVADAYYSQASFLNSLVAEGITVLSRLRKDAMGWDDPAPVVGERPRGRPRAALWHHGGPLLRGGRPRA